jgi:hypothetical protein
MCEKAERDRKTTLMLHVHTADRISIAARAREMVATQPYFRGTSYPIRFESFEDVLVISGRVPSFHLKQVLQSEVGRMEGIGRVVNQVVVDYARFGS